MPTPKLGKFLGRMPDRQDLRDFVLKVESHLDIGAPHAQKVDTFAGLNLPVMDQGSIGSCTSNSGVLYRRFLAQKFPQYSAPDRNLSRLALYYWERLLEGTTQTDAGAESRDICKALVKYGVCPEEDDPYVERNFAQAPSPRALDDALQYRVGAYHRVAGVSSAKSCLSLGYPLLFGFTVYGSLEDVVADGIWSPKKNEAPIGGHETVIRGFDDTVNGGSFFAQNSWSADWGKAGCFFVPYWFVEDLPFSQNDLWMMHLGKPWK